MRRLTLIIVGLWVALAGYALCYAAVRGSHRLVHTALWISEEGLNGHHVHGMNSTEEALLDAFRPLVWLETRVHDILGRGLRFALPCRLDGPAIEGDPMRRLVVIALTSFSACQCFQPVDERADAGRDAGGGASDAGLRDGGGADAGGGTDAGLSDAGLSDAGLPDAGSSDAGVACTTAADCTVPGPGQQFCGTLRAACVNNHCLLECPVPDAGQRTCQSNTTECLTCDGATRQCAMCDARVCTFTVDPVQGTCAAPFDDVRPFVVQPFSGRCGGGILRDGGVAGVWVGTLGIGRILLDIPALGGTCLGSPLFTQVPRTLISCPACTFVAEGCE